MMIMRREIGSDWVDIKDFGAVLISKSLPDTPSINNFEMEGALGRKRLHNTGYTDRQFDVKLLVKNKTLKETNLIVEELSWLFSGQFDVIFKDEDDRIYLDVALSNGISSEKIGGTSKILDVSMTAYNPFKYSLDKTSVTIDVNDNGIHTINNLGSYQAKPIITLTGSASEINITVGENTTTYVGLSVLDKIIIDCEKYTVVNDKFGEITTALSNWRNNFIVLNKGLNEVKITGDTIRAKIKVEYRNTFL